jgi:hypothetical protein
MVVGSSFSQIKFGKEITMFTTITYRMARVLTLLALVVTMLVGALPAWADGATVIRGDIIDILGQPSPRFSCIYRIY